MGWKKKLCFYLEESACNGPSEFLSSYCSEFGAAAFLIGLCHKCESLPLCLSICVAAMVEFWHASNLFRMKFLLRKRSLRRLRLVRIASALVWAASLLVQVDVIFLEEAFIAKKNGHSDSDEKLTILSALYLMPSAGLGPQQVDLRFALQILFLEWARWRFILSEFSQPASLTWRFCWQRPCFCHSHAAARG